MSGLGQLSLYQKLPALPIAAGRVFIINVRDNYALKQSAFNRMMQTNKKFASTVEKAKANGFRLCPVVPDDYAGMNLDSYVDIVQVHLHAVEEKMKEALK